MADNIQSNNGSSEKLSSAHFLLLLVFCFVFFSGCLFVCCYFVFCFSFAEPKYSIVVTGRVAASVTTLVLL